MAKSGNFMVFIIILEDKRLIFIFLILYLYLKTVRQNLILIFKLYIFN